MGSSRGLASPTTARSCGRSLRNMSDMMHRLLHAGFICLVAAATHIGLTSPGREITAWLIVFAALTLITMQLTRCFIALWGEDEPVITPEPLSVAGQDRLHNLTNHV